MNSPRPMFRWLGAKWQLAPWITANMPPHSVYCEPYGGSGAVLMCKQPATHEIYNDADGDLVNVFRVLRDPESCARLGDLLTLTPYARDEFMAAYERADDPVEQARRVIVRGAMSHGSDAITRGYRTGFKVSTRQRVSDACAWAQLPPRAATWCRRLRTVCIEHDDALAVMRRYDSPETLHYIDPPYPWATREPSRAKRAGRPKHGYRHEMDDEQHIALAHVLHGLRGMVMLSSYASDLYESLYGGWPRIETAATDQANNARTELLWFNPRAWQARPETKAMFTGQP